MKKVIILLALCCIIVSCSTKQTQFSTSENLANHIDEIVTLEGRIAHVCSADGRKMKLILSDDEIITVWQKNPNERFYKNDWQGKTIQVTGKLSADTITKSEFDTVFAQQHILCHIDQTPCIDAAWVNNQWERGNAEELIARQQQQVYEKMSEKSTDYIQQFSIIVDELKKISIKN